MEVLYEGKEKLEKSKMRFEVYRHNFTAELEDGECFPFHVDEPNTCQIFLDEPICTAKGHILFGLVVMDSKDFIEKTVKENMVNLEKSQNKEEEHHGRKN